MILLTAQTIPKGLIIFLLIVGVILYTLYYIFKDSYLNISPQRRQELRTKRKQEKNLPYKTGTLDDCNGIMFGIKKFLGNITYYYSPAEDEGHLVVLGGSGIGKTAAILISTLLIWCKNNNKNTSFTVDISGDIIANSDMSNMLVYSPLPPEDKELNIPQGTPYNIFYKVDLLDDEDEINRYLTELVNDRIKIDNNESEGSKYYKRQARNILTAAFVGYYFSGLDFCDICDKVYYLTYEDLFNDIENQNNEYASAKLNGFVGITPEFIRNALQDAKDSIELFVLNKNIRKTLRRPKDGEASINATSVENSNVFLYLPDPDLEYLQPLTELILSQVLDYLSRRMHFDHKILLTLDEAASLGQIDILPVVRKYRKRGVRLILLTQTLSDIDITWGHDKDTVRSALLSNFKFKILLESSDEKEQASWGRLIGNEIKDNYSHTTGHTESSTRSEHKDFIINPHELASLGDELIFLYPGGYKKLEKCFYYKYIDPTKAYDYNEKAKEEKIINLKYLTNKLFKRAGE